MRSSSATRSPHLAPRRRCRAPRSARPAPPRPRPRVERAVGVLEDHLEAAAAPPQLPGAEGEEVLAVEADAPGGRLDQPDEAAAERGLAAARLPHQRQALAARDLEIDAVDRAHHAAVAPQQAAADREVLADVGGREQRRGGATATLMVARAGSSAIADRRPPRTAAATRADSARTTSGQRGWKAHAGGRSAASGTWPGIDGSLPRAAGCAEPRQRGEQTAGVGMRRRGEEGRRRPPPPPPRRRTSPPRGRRSPPPPPGRG